MKYTGQTPICDYMNLLLNTFSDDCSYAIWGCAEQRYKFIQKYCPSIKCIVDGDIQKQGKYFHGVKVDSPEVLAMHNYKVIVAVQDYSVVCESLNRYGLSEADFCSYQEYMLIKSCAANSIFLPEVALYITGHCNLKCKNCMVYAPYQKQPTQITFEEASKSLQHLFQYVDLIGDIHFAGGETFLEQRILSRMLQHISENYGDKYLSCGIVTNGTIIPDVDCLAALKKSNSYVIISDYTSQIGQKSKIGELEKVLKNWTIPYKIEGKFGRIEENQWFDFGEQVPFNKSPEMLKEHFEQCSSTCLEIYNSKLFNCALVLGATINLAYPQTINDYFDLSVKPQSENDYLRFIKYCIGACDNGYYNWCDYCNGYGTLLNKKVAKPGEQL